MRLRFGRGRVTVARVHRLLLFSLFVLVSCAITPCDPRLALVGEWLYEDAAQSCRYIFDKQGTFTGEVRQGGQSLSRFRGTWSVEGDALLYQYTGDELGRIPAGTRDRDKLLKTTPREFVIEATDGSRRIYRRVR